MILAQPPATAPGMPPGAVARLGHANFWHGAAIRALALSPDESVIASFGADNRICLWDRATGKLRRSWTAASQPEEGAPRVLSAVPGSTLVFASDGKTLAMADMTTQRCRRWDTESGKELSGAALSFREEEIEPPAGLVAPAKGLGKRGVVGVFGLSPDGRRVALAQLKDSSIHVVTDGKQPVNKLAGHTARIHAIAFAADGRALASGGDDQTVRIWNLEQGKLIATLTGHRAAVQELAFAPDGQRLLSASVDGSLRLWDVATGKALAQASWKPAHLQDGSESATTAARTVTSMLQSVWFEADGTSCGALYSIAFGTTGLGEDAVVRLETATGRILNRQVVHDHRTTASSFAATALLATRTVGTRAIPVAFAPKNRLLVRAAPSSHVQVLAIDTGLPASTGLHASCTDVEMTGALVAIVQQGDPNIYLWNWRAQQPLRKLTGHTGHPFLVGFDRRGQHLVSASRDPADRSLSLWDVAGAAELRQFAGWHAGTASTSTSTFAVRQATTVYVPAPRLSQDGKRLAFRGLDGRLRVVDVSTGKDVASYAQTWKGDGCIAFTADSRHVILSHAYENRKVAPAAKAKAMRDANCYLQMIDIVTGKDVGQLAEQSHDFHITRLAVADRRALVACKDGSIRSINLPGGKSVHDIWTPRAPVKQPAGFAAAALTTSRIPFFVASDDGRMIAVRSHEEPDIKIVEVATGKVRHTLPVPASSITSMGFAPDSMHLVTGSQDGSVVVWTLGPLDATGADAAMLWQQFTGADAAASFGALRKLLAMPAAAADLAGKHVQPATPPDESRVAQKIRELDSPVFTTRQKAQDELARLGETIRGHLEKTAADKNASAEATQRIAAILKRLDADVLTGDRLRDARTVELLLRLDTAEANAVLRRLAAGAPGALLTLDAQAALKLEN